MTSTLVEILVYIHFDSLASEARQHENSKVLPDVLRVVVTEDDLDLNLGQFRRNIALVYAQLRSCPDPKHDSRCETIIGDDGTKYRALKVDKATISMTSGSTTNDGESNSSDSSVVSTLVQNECALLIGSTSNVAKNPQAKGAIMDSSKDLSKEGLQKLFEDKMCFVNCGNISSNSTRNKNQTTKNSSLGNIARSISQKKALAATEELENWLSTDRINLQQLVEAQRGVWAQETAKGNPKVAANHPCSGTLRLLLVPMRDMPPPTIRVAIVSIKKVVDGIVLMPNVGSSKSYVQYNIVVRQSRLEWVISRRFSDFVRLHRALTNQDPSESGYIPADLIPELPSKYTNNKFVSCAEFVVQYRKKELQGFLNGLLKFNRNEANQHILRFLGLLNSNRGEEDDAMASSDNTITTYVNSNGETVVNTNKRPLIHLSKLQGTVRWGDIILFRCVNNISSLQRKITGSSWDHCGLVVSKGGGGRVAPVNSSTSPPFFNNHNISELYLLESTAQGVTVFPLLPRLNAYHNTKFCEAIGLRCYYGTRTQEMYSNMVSFVNAVHGAPYGFKLSKLLFTNEYTRNNTDGGANWGGWGTEDEEDVDCDGNGTLCLPSTAGDGERAKETNFFQRMWSSLFDVCSRAESVDASATGSPIRSSSSSSAPAPSKRSEEVEAGEEDQKPLKGPEESPAKLDYSSGKLDEVPKESSPVEIISNGDPSDNDGNRSSVSLENSSPSSPTGSNHNPMLLADAMIAEKTVTSTAKPIGITTAKAAGVGASGSVALDRARGDKKQKQEPSKKSMAKVSSPNSAFSSISKSDKQSNGTASSGAATTYFCSELVAACLIAMAVIQPHHNPAFFWPDSFAQGKYLDTCCFQHSDHNTRLSMDVDASVDFVGEDELEEEDEENDDYSFSSTAERSDFKAKAAGGGAVGSEGAIGFYGDELIIDCNVIEVAKAKLVNDATDSLPVARSPGLLSPVLGSDVNKGTKLNNSNPKQQSIQMKQNPMVSMQNQEGSGLTNDEDACAPSATFVPSLL